MAEKKFGLKKLFSKSNKDCCSVTIEEVNPANENCCSTNEKESSSNVKKAQ